MDQKVLDFLSTERVCSLAEVMPDGSSHSAAMHFCFDSARRVFYFLTPKSSFKCTALTQNSPTPASIAVGFSEESMITVQLGGSLHLASQSDLPTVKDIYFAKFPQSRRYDSPDSAYLIFTVSHWRYTDHKTDEVLQS